MKTIKSTKGSAFFTPCILVIVLAIIFSAVFTYASAVTKVNMMRENSKVVLDSFVTQNSTEIYKSIKQGNDHTEAVDGSEYVSALVRFCALEEDGEKLYSMNDDGTEKFHISRPAISFRRDNELKLVAEYTVSLPINFAGISFTVASVPIEVTSLLTEKF